MDGDGAGSAHNQAMRSVGGCGGEIASQLHRH